MRTSIIIARKHGTKKFELLSGPETPFVEHKQFLRDTLSESATVHERFAEIHHWESHGGGNRVLRFKTAKDQKEMDRLSDEQAHSHAESQAAIAKSKLADGGEASNAAPNSKAEKPKSETVTADWN